ncbi:MAG: type II toxin-antitoxin system prevent-host-death family antitoxin [Armatimonadota bacterium]
MKSEPETISVTELRERTREILENAHFRRKRYRVERAGQPMVVIIGVDDFEQLAARSQPGRETSTMSGG